VFALERCRFEVDDTLSQQVLGVRLGDGLLLVTENKVIKDLFEKLSHQLFFEEPSSSEVLIRQALLNELKFSLSDVSLLSALQHEQQDLSLVRKIQVLWNVVLI
jgi:hypothetical protein